MVSSPSSSVVLIIVSEVTPGRVLVMGSEAKVGKIVITEVEVVPASSDEPVSEFGGDPDSVGEPSSSVPGNVPYESVAESPVVGLVSKGFVDEDPVPFGAGSEPVGDSELVSGSPGDVPVIG